MRHLLAPLLCLAMLSISAIAENPSVVMKTNHGDITIELNQEKCPVTVKNFLSYVSEKHYDGTIFHRVIDGFMIQGGGFANGMIPEEKKTKAPIKNEAKDSGLSNLRGTIAMARTNAPHSATAQFFINVKDNKNLDAGGFSEDGYAVFGKVTAGMDVVDKIKAVETGRTPLKARAGDTLREQPMSDVPTKTVVIKSVSLLTKVADPVKAD